MSIYDYAELRVATDVVVLTTKDNDIDDARKVPTKSLQVLLIKRDTEPYNNMWTLPGVFVDKDRGITDCLDDKLFSQKTGIKSVYREQLATYGDNIHRDPRDRVISVAYIALADKHTLESNMQHGSKEKQWFTIEQLRNKDAVVGVKLVNEKTGEVLKEIGFDHEQMIIDAINRLANKIMYTDIGLNLVPIEFTIKELQMAYECVIQREISNFRRIIEGKIIETGKTTSDVKEKADLHRPAKLYRRK